MRFAVGARFVCMKCSLRGVTAKCAHCRGETIDLTTRDLDGDWPLWKAHLDGKRLFAPAVARRAKWLRRVALVLTVLNVIPAFVMPFIKDRGQAPLSALIAGSVVGVLVMTPLVFFFYWAFLFVAALTFHALGVLFTSLAEWVPIGELRLRIVAFISNLISRPLLGLIRLEPPENVNAPSPLRGALAAPLTVDLQRDRLVVLERADAVLGSPLSILFDGAAAPEPVDFSAGVLVCTQPGMTKGTPQLPKWLQPVRDGTARRTELQTGTRVVLRRGAEGVVQLDVL
jgi:hypothetical protein